MPQNVLLGLSPSKDINNSEKPLLIEYAEKITKFKAWLTLEDSSSCPIDFQDFQEIMILYPDTFVDIDDLYKALEKCNFEWVNTNWKRKYVQELLESSMSNSVNFNPENFPEWFLRSYATWYFKKYFERINDN